MDASQRALLEKAIAQVRRVLERDLQTVLEARFGIHPGGRVEDEDRLRLAATERVAREELLGVVEHLRATGLTQEEAASRLLREAVFTTANCLVAVRVAEASGLLPESLARGKESRGYREVLEVFPLLAKDATAGYWTYLRLCADELAHDAPVLFDPRNPLLVLEPSPKALDELVGVLADADLARLWADPEALGWTYQYFVSQEERRAAREEAAPRDSRELAVRNQWFTPRYVVDFLVQNTLGRRILEADPGSALREELHLLVDPPTRPGGSLDLEEVRVLDPAVGSGHFLLGCYDLLERAWQERSVPPAEAAARILPCLWGIDIDPRCAQVAAAALVLRARRRTKDGELPRPHIYTARALPRDPSVWERALAGLDGGLRALAGRIAAALEDAPIVGSLLKVEEVLREEIERYAPETTAHEGQLFEAASGDAFQRVEARLLAVLRTVAAEASSSAAERLLAAEAADAIGFIEAVRGRYDAVLMNPPFGSPVRSTKAYLTSAYPWTPATCDLFALFVGRGLELCKANGYVGAITSRVGFFLSGFSDWRKDVLLGYELITVADLGEGVMEGAMVEAAAYVLAGRAPTSARRPVFLRVLTSTDRPTALGVAVEAARAGKASPDVLRPEPETWTVLEGSPFVYWIDSRAIQTLAQHEPFEPRHGVVRVGLQTGDDFRFVRAWWEVPAERLIRPPGDAGGDDERGQLARGARWVPIVKGQASQPWYSPIILVVDWERDGERIRGFVGANGKLKSRPQNTHLYFRPGFSWTLRAPRLVPYVVPAGSIPSVSRYQAFPSGDPYSAVGIVASNVATAFCRFYGEKFLWPKFLVDNVKSIPVPPIAEDLRANLAARVRTEVERRREIYRHLEPYREFTVPKEKPGTLKWDPRSLLGENLEKRVAEACGLASAQAAELERDMREALAALRMEATSADEASEVEEVPPWSERLVSYLVGVAFGRWDARIGRDSSLAPTLPDPFEPMPACPPGMLVGPDGLPAADAPPGYPLELPPDRILPDEEGHPWDLVYRITLAAEYLFDDPDGLLRDAEASLGGDLRTYLRRRFFRDHLRCYSKAGRTAPIYWHLSVPSRNWGIWAYAPALSREMLFAVVREARRKETALTEVVEQLQRKAGEAQGREAHRRAKRLEAEEKLLQELRAFRSEAERVANLGWEPDLDDGIVLCAAPLANLFPAWRAAGRADSKNPADPEQARKLLKAHRFPWATVSRFAGEL